MSRRSRRNHTPAFKAKAALATIKGDRTLAPAVCGTWLRQVNVGFQGKSSHALDKVEPPSLTPGRDIKFPARAARGGPSTSS
jgi:hypothetical protein